MHPLEEREVMDYRKSAQEELDNIGGAGNVVSAAHCATRLRLVIADNAKVDKEALENIHGAKGVFEAQGQLQIIFGTGTVNKVYDEFIALSGVEAATKAEVKEAAAQQQNIFMRAIKVLGDVFVPIIPAIVASGLLLGIMSALNFMASNGFIALDTNNFIYKIADLVSGASFGILQILIGYSAAKAFGANPYLGAVVGGAFINSSLQSAYTVASEGVQTMVTVIPGVYSLEWVGYQGHVIPLVIACALLAFLEKRLHKIVPEMFDLFVTPLVSVFVTVLVTLVAVGPIFVWAENAILGLIQALLTLPFGIGSFIVGLFYAPTVVTGIHQMYTAIDLGQLAQYGVTYWLPIASAANIAQGGAALAVAGRVAARAGIRRPNQQEASRKACGAFRSGNRDISGFQRFAQRLQRTRREFRSLVHEQDAAMRAGDGSGLGQSCASTHQRGGRRVMVGRLERWNVADSVSGKRAA